MSHRRTVFLGLPLGGEEERVRTPSKERTVPTGGAEATGGPPGGTGGVLVTQLGGGVQASAGSAPTAS